MCEEHAAQAARDAAAAASAIADADGVEAAPTDSAAANTDTNGTSKSDIPKTPANV